ncbi:hypothetical protein [Limosilactobacillus mucosae]|jgi:hypothetical protein|uniref:hypothetical protein n=1 Tax=Limosilactobacillus mucosae TaxID=97478 RepID=UPI00206BDF27|nr:hypothetical protein [Limosilactobacillus mucosae]DAJ71981.1 MAG TPA: hypothetical protein [Caudoviricetes sp.]
MRSLYRRIENNCRIQEIFLATFFIFALSTFISDLISPNHLVTKFLKDFVMPIISPFVFLIFGMINTENEKIGHKLNKH